jgi:exosortase
MGELHNNRGIVKAVILAGGRDFGRCPMASLLPPPLWPIEGTPVLLRLLSQLAASGVKQAVVCGADDNELYGNIVKGKVDLDVSFLEEPLPIGTAGCIRDAAGNDKHQMLLVFPATIISLPHIEWLLNTHAELNADLTVFVNTPYNNCDGPQIADIYLCGPQTLNHIPTAGYFDIKEGFIPALWRADKSIKVAALQKPVRAFHNAAGYLSAVCDYLTFGRPDILASSFTDHNNPFIHSFARISPTARICGPVMVMENAVICDDAIVLGPAVIERDVIIESSAIVSQSILWPGTHIGANACLNECVTFYNTIVPPKAILEAKPLVPHADRFAAALEVFETSLFENIQKLRYGLQAALGKITNSIPLAAGVEKRLSSVGEWFWFCLLFAGFFWLYEPEISQLWKIWLGSDEYGSGLIVPFLAAYVLWNRRKELALLPRQHLKAGLALFLFAQGLRIFGLVFMHDWLRQLSLVFSIIAIVLYVFGWQVFRKIAPIMLFLFLMLPLPKTLHANITAPLQNWAASSAVFSLKTVGLEVTREGNIINVGSTTIAVAEECSGLRMITAFFVICGLVVLLVERTWWEKLIILASAVPIGLFCNTLRLALTALAFTILKGPFWEKTLHYFGGVAMMPVALGVVILELWILKHFTNDFKYQEKLL